MVVTSPIVSTVVMMNAKRLGMTSGAYTDRGKVNTQRKVMGLAEGGKAGNGDGRGGGQGDI